MNKKLLALALAALMIFALAACEVSSSSTSTTTVTTSTTDADGNTTTSTTTTEVGASVGSDGITTTNETTTETTTTAADGQTVESEGVDAEGWQQFVDRLYDTYNVGAEGRSAAGDYIYYAYNEDSDDAILTIVSEDEQSLSSREGTIMAEDDHVVLYSEEMNDETPFVLGEKDDEGNFTMTFLGDGDVADMHTVDQDTVLGDILARLQEFEQG